MKVFKFNPKTGRRGESLYGARLATWTDAYDSTYSGPEPDGFGNNADVHVHKDAGVSDREMNDISYRHDTDWVCFCFGQIVNGPWEWVIIPPKD